MKRFKHLSIIAIITTLLIGCEVPEVDSNLNNNHVDVVVTDSENNNGTSMVDNSESDINDNEEDISYEQSTDDNDSTENKDNGSANDSTEETTDETSNNSTSNSKNEPITFDATTIEAMFPGHTYLYVTPGDIHQERLPNVVVDIGFGDRWYFSLTNEFSQVYRVVADEIIIQDDSTEPVNSDGRYYSQIADVRGTESSTLDRGHLIADSLGGENSKYAIVPQDSTLNRHGDQAYMEDTIRKAIRAGLRVTNFEAIITYPNTETMIPSHFKYTYYIDGDKVVDEFDNVDPDEVNAQLDTETTENTDTIVDKGSLEIVALDKGMEYITIKNTSEEAIDITGYMILSVRGEQSFHFPSYIIEGNSTVKIGDEDKNSDVNFHWLDGRGTWNNSSSDPAELYDVNGVLIDRWDD
ncbi:MAG: lamin tail domain-containing protein [Clostridiales bacterium]|nr:lamin tail domain-containing protein [Clostridiales bacterium]